MTSERITHDGSARCPVEDDAVVSVTAWKSLGLTHSERKASAVPWEHVYEYQVIQGWSSPLADIFAELPDEAEWIVADCEGSQWFECEPSLADGIWDSPHGLGAESVFDAYVGDIRESKRKRPAVRHVHDAVSPGQRTREEARAAVRSVVERKRPEPKRDRAFDLAREATAGQLDSLKEIIKRGGVEAILNNCVNETESAEIERVDLPTQYQMTNAELLEAIKHFTGLVGTKSARQDEKYIRHLDMLMDVQCSRAVASFTAKVERTNYENGGE